ncbi:MAG: 50S ribosomal protein L11 methyltransferase [Alphaproteobacteria bacterium]
MSRPFALFIRGAADDIFTLSDALGFDEEMNALAVSIFEDGSSRVPSGRMFVQALYETKAEAETALRGLSLPAEMEYSISQLPDEDWVTKSQSGLPPVSAGRFWVYGSHDADNVPIGAAHPVHIDAGLAFGTGHHGTTKGCLIIFDELLSGGFKPKHVLDLGAGAGTLAIAAAMALEQNILATDIDQDAVDVTAQNAEINGVADYITSVQADGFDSPALDGRKFNLIFANILAGPLMGLAPNIVKALASGGRVILSGIIDDQAEKVAKRFEDEGLSITPYPSIDGWTSLLGAAPP